MSATATGTVVRLEDNAGTAMFVVRWDAEEWEESGATPDESWTAHATEALELTCPVHNLSGEEAPP